MRLVFRSGVGTPLWSALFFFFFATLTVSGADPVSLTDISAGTLNSTPQNVVELGGKVYFTAIVTGTPSRREVFVYDPAQPSGSQVARVSNFAGSAASTTTPYALRAVGTKLTMVADGSANGNELWVYDPATATLSEASINGTWSTNTSNAPKDFLVHEGKLYFAANNGNRDLSYTQNATFVSGVSGGTGYQLWVYDPDIAIQSGVNPRRLTNLNTVNPAGAGPTNLVGLPGRILFSASLSYYDNQWGIYGTFGGGAYGPDDQELVMFTIATEAVTTYDLAQGSTTETFNGLSYTNKLDSSPLGVRAVVNDAVYFTANATDSPHGASNQRGTVLMKFAPASMSAPVKAAEFNSDSGSGASGDSIGSMAVIGSVVYFTATNGANGTELYSYDTSTGAAGLAAELAAGGTSGISGHVVAFNNRVYFNGDSGAGQGFELWSYNPATTTAALVADINTGSVSSGPSQFFASQNKLYFRATEANTGTELWIFDPGDSSTTRLSDVSAGTGNGVNFQTANPSINQGNTLPNAIGFGTDLVFSGSNATVGIELFHFASTAVALPVVTSISPVFGALSGGTSVTLTGTDFTGATSVKFGSTAAVSFIVNSATSITAISPAAAPGTINITVTTAGGTSASAAGNQFTFAAVPTLTSPTSSSIALTSATLGGTVSSDGGGAITARGVVVSPTAANSNPQVGGSGVIQFAGTGTTGAFTVGASGLTPGTAYSFKAYATNVSGTSYTSTGTFTTVDETQTGSAGSGMPFANEQPTSALTWVICINGVYPSAGAGTASTEPFLGEIRLLPFDSQVMSSVWKPCSGQLLPINQNQALFSLLGISFGGNGQTNFALPDLRGRVPVGMGEGPGMTDRSLGERGGQESTVLTVNQLPVHNHTYNGGNTGTAGSGAAIDNMQPWLALNFAVMGGSGFPDAGWIRIFAFNLTPGGHYACNGAQLNIPSDTALFSRLGTIYGGNGTTTFAVPDFRGRTPIGAGAGIGLTPRTLGTAGGSESFVLSTSQMTAHVHTYSAGNTGSAGGSASHSTMQPFLTVNAAIAPNGVYGNIDSSPAVGELRLFASSGLPDGWLPGNGALVRISDYETLFILIGTTYGGDGELTFAVPDLSGCALSGVGLGPAGVNRMLGEKWGSEEKTLLVTNLPAHVHLFGPTPEITNATLAASGTYGSVFSTYTITASGGPNRFSATGLPSGLSVNPTNGQISGTPTATGTFTATIGATNDIGIGTATLTITIAKAAQTISWTAIPDKTFGEAAFTVTASATSGLPVAYTVVAGPATISGNTVSITGTGAVTLRASQGGNVNFNAAVDANTGFMVGKATAVVTLGNLSATYDGTAKSASATTNPTGLMVVLTYNGDGTAPTNAGSYAVVATIAHATYQGSASGTLTIGKAPLTVTAVASTKLYGSPNPVFSVALTGFVNGQLLATSGVTGVANTATGATAASPVGVYNVTPSLGSLAAGNYAFTDFVAGALTVTKATLTVTADDKSRGYGGPNPEFTAAVAGFVNGDTLAATTGAPVLTSTATTSSAQGTYPIHIAAGTLASANYDFSLEPGTLTVTKAVLTVKPDDISKVYGAVNPALTYTITGFINGDSAGVVNGTPGVSTTATLASPADAYPIVADISGLSAANYIFAAAPGTLTVTKAVLTVTAEDKSKIYGAANPEFTAAITGYLNGDTSAVVTGAPSLSTEATAASPVNTYAIAATAGTLVAANYGFAFAPGSLSVTKAPLTVTADAKSKTYGATNPVLTTTISGFVNGESLATSGVTGAAVLTTAATASSPVQAYAISATSGTLTANNYDLTNFVDGTLTVSQAVLQVAAESKSKMYGTANPDLTATISGFVNGDTRTSAVTGAPALSTSATLASSAGSYLISVDAGTLAASNYTFSFTRGELLVGRAVLTVTADNKTRAFNGANPPLTATITGFASGDTVTSATTGAPVLSSNDAASSSVGKYAITAAAGSLASPNYSFAFADGVLTITPATATIALGSLSRTYNGQPQAASFTTTPAGLGASLIYGGSSSAPTNAGSYQVSAVINDFNYQGVTSGSLVITKAPQRLTFGVLGNSLNVGAPITLSATASSGLPVVFSMVSGNASIHAATLVVNDTGAVVVRATQAGDDNWLAATAEQTLSGAAKRAQTISFAPLDAHDLSAGPITLQATASSGLPVTFIVLNGPAIIQGNVVSFTGSTGNVAIGALQPGDEIWAAAPSVQRTFEVTADSPDIFFGEVGDGSGQNVGTVAAALPAGRKPGTLIVVAPGVNAVFELQIERDGSFRSTINVESTSQSTEGPVSEPWRAASVLTLTARGRSENGVVLGQIEEFGLSFNAKLLSHVGATAGIAGYYHSSTLNSSEGSTAAIVGSQGQVLLVASTSGLTTGAAGHVESDGTFLFHTPGATVAGAIDAPTNSVSGTIRESNQPPVAFAGLDSTTARTDRLVNLSSRVRVGPAGGRTLITGFVIGGVDAKQILLRAIGPALENFGVANALGNPRLELYDAAGVRILQNEDWTGDDTAAAFSKVGAFSLAPGARDAALLTTLAPGAYTMHVSDDGGSGVVLAEIYDASAKPGSEYQRLVNLSSRGTVDAGDGVLIGGFVVTGNSPKRVLIRGVGPALTAYGVDGALADPRLTVFSGQALIAQNDNWGTPAAVGPRQIAASGSEIAVAAHGVGAFAYGPNSKDAAVVVTLAPGAYTAQVTSTDGTTGVALVEVYELPE